MQRRSPPHPRRPTPNATATPPQNCYASNPPSSGRHLNVQKNVDLGNGVVLAQIPPNPAVYPHDIVFPRESIPHILEHAGVYVGWNCKDDDQACLDAIQKVEDLANDRIDNHNDLVRMARDTDLPFGVLGLASWTRYETDADRQPRPQGDRALHGHQLLPRRLGRLL